MSVWYCKGTVQRPEPAHFSEMWCRQTCAVLSVLWLEFEKWWFSPLCLSRSLSLYIWTYESANHLFIHATGERKENCCSSLKTSILFSYRKCQKPHKIIIIGRSVDFHFLIIWNIIRLAWLRAVNNSMCRYSMISDNVSLRSLKGWYLSACYRYGAEF